MRSLTRFTIAAVLLTALAARPGKLTGPRCGALHKAANLDPDAFGPEAHE